MAKTTWTMDPAHAELRFKVRHLMVSWVSGSFENFSATLETEEQDMTTAKVTVKAAISSLSTNNEQRDTHLRSNDFFDAANHPQLTFESDRMKKITDEEYELTGRLTMRGVTHPIILHIEFGGIITDPKGHTRTGFTVSGKVNRTDYGITFTRLSETGDKLLGETITIAAEVEFTME